MVIQEVEERDHGTVVDLGDTGNLMILQQGVNLTQAMPQETIPQEPRFFNCILSFMDEKVSLGRF